MLRTPLWPTARGKTANCEGMSSCFDHKNLKRPNSTKPVGVGWKPDDSVAFEICRKPVVHPVSVRSTPALKGETRVSELRPDARSLLELFKKEAHAATAMADRATNEGDWAGYLNVAMEWLKLASEVEARQ